MAPPKSRPRVLSRELKALTESGLIDRMDYGVVPPKVEYRLTRKGKSFVPVIAAIRDWGDAPSHAGRLRRARDRNGSGITGPQAAPRGDARRSFETTSRR